MTTDLVPYGSRPPASLDEAMSTGKIMAQSGFFADSRDAAQAIVKILAGAELGFGPVASMTGIYIVKGRVTISANLMAAAIKRSGRYNYRVTELTDTTCEIAFFENGQSCGTSRFTTADADRAGLKTETWRAYPRNMLFSRALSNGARWYCADVLGGPVYTEGEIPEAVDAETGEILPRATVTTERADLPGDTAMADEIAAERRHFWGTAKELGYTSKRAVHELLGIEVRDGALADWKAQQGLTWNELTDRLTDLHLARLADSDPEQGELLSVPAERTPAYAAPGQH